MKAASPTVSVVMSSYNHAAYVGEAIESVLSQTYGDFEFLVTDDGSTDGTQDVIAGYSDPRLHFAPLTKNIGAAAAYNTQIERATGEYVAIISSDDVWLPDQLEYQVELLDRLPDYGANFGQMTYMDLSGNPYDNQPQLVEHDIDQPGGWHLRRFMTSANALNHPTALIRRRVYDEIGLYDNRLRQTPDYAQWVQLVKRFRIYVSERRLINYRWQQGHNTSSQGGSTQANRDAFEYRQLAETMLAATPPEMLLQGFGDLLIDEALDTAEHIDVERALLHLRKELPHGSRQFGAQRLFHLLGAQQSRELLQTEYRIGDLDFQQLTGDIDAGADGLASLPEPRSRVVLSLASKPCLSEKAHFDHSDDASHAGRLRIPCLMLAYHDVPAAERTLINLSPLADRLELIFVENPSENSSAFEELVRRYMEQGIVSRYFRFDDNIRTCAVDVILRRELDLPRLPFVIVTEADLEANSDTWLDEELAAMREDPLVFAMGMTLDPSNLPLETVPESRNWIGNDLVGDRGSYIETTTGCYNLLFRGPELAKALDQLNRGGRYFLDAFLHEYCYGTARRRWARTKHSMAYHIAWDYYADPNHAYTTKRASMSVQEQFYVRRHSGFREFSLDHGWQQRDISDDPGDLFQRSLDAFAEGNLAEGALACDRLLCLGSIRNEYREKTHQNLRFYAQPLANLIPGGEMLAFDGSLPGSRLAYLTVVADDNVLVVVAQEQPSDGADGPKSPVSCWLQRVTPELEPLGDPSLVTRCSAAAETGALDDLRIVRVGEDWLGTAMLGPSESGSRPALGVVRLDLDSGEIAGAQQMGDVLTSIREPGAMPFEAGGELHVVQQCGPTVVLRADQDRRLFSLAASHPAPRLCEWFRDGTQLQPHDDGYLAVVRESAEFDDGRQDMHRIVRFGADLRIEALSHAFTIQGLADERCSGLAILGGKAYLACTVDGDRAMLVKLDLAGVLALLRPASHFLSEGLYTWSAGCGLPAS